MSIREGRGRSRRDYPSRSEEKPNHGRGSNPPSRHLWVGNLSHNLSESGLAQYFLEFGELESLAFQPGRSYAFVNYINEEDAFAAMRELPGYVIEGNPIRMEFAKAEKSLPPQRDADYSDRRDGPHPKGRVSPYSQRDFRARRSSPEQSYQNKSKMNDKNAEPSEVLWVGFPAQLKMDEFVLRKAFSPFGDIEKITAFPGRTYAFIRFRNVMAASRAKEALHGKLFGNPRVHICFAKNDLGPSNRERNMMNDTPSPRVGSYGRSGSFKHFQSDRDYNDMHGDHSIRSPPYMPNLDNVDHEEMGLARNMNLWPARNNIHDRRWVPRQGSELGLPRNMYDRSSSPPRNLRTRDHEFSPNSYPRQGPIYDDPWDLPEDVSFLHGKRKRETDPFPPENELPEYPLEDLEKAKRVFPRDNPQSRIHEKNYNSRNSGYRPIPERSGQPFVERGDHLNASHDDFQVGSRPLPLPHPDKRKLNPDLQESSSKEVWRWEGMISKGGTSVCRARCFPVGKPPDMVLPEYLDCTARTSLDMLAKHYYQAANAWVVFFAPANDPDIAYYNEFMKYLGDKQRAAVVKLDERNTLFLVPPSDFCEKVLKVPGKLSISGVVLRLDPPGSSYASLPQNENRETPFTSFQHDSVYQTSISPSGPYLPAGPEYAHNSQPVIRNVTQQTAGQPYSSFPRPMQEAAHSSYTPDVVSSVPLNGNGKWAPVSENPSSGLSSRQLAQLASSLLGQQGQQSGVSSAEEYRPSGNVNQPGYSYKNPENYGFPGEQVSPEFQTPQFQQLQQQQQQQQGIAAQAVAMANQQFQNTEQDEEADPQKRLQATLQLAAALLQQIQQGKGT
ncbi:hypothetical protein ACS0TY_017476 [Phlomoides rotata]